MCLFFSSLYICLLMISRIFIWFCYVNYYFVVKYSNTKKVDGMFSLFFFFLFFDIDNIPDIFHIRRWGTVRPDNCVSRCLCYCKNLSYFWLSFLYIWQLHDFTWYCELKKLKLNIFFSLPYIDINTNTFLSKSQYLSFL